MTQNRPQSSGSPMKSGLGHLPPELRRLIWSACLCVGNVNPFSQDVRTKAEVSAVALLRVSKTIYDEAKGMLFLNTVVLSEISAIEKFLESKERCHALKTVHVEFNADDLDYAAASEVGTQTNEELFDARCNDEPEDEENPLFLQFYHRNSKVKMQDRWVEKMIMIMEKTEHTQMSIGIQDCFCRTDCCSLHAMAVCAIWDAHTTVNKPHQITDIQYHDEQDLPDPRQGRSYFEGEIVDHHVESFVAALKANDVEPVSEWLQLPSPAEIVSWASIPQWLLDTERLELESRGRW